ncbi:hypothetical protein GCM10027035_47640 [Emticicia sediminis]
MVAEKSTPENIIADKLNSIFILWVAYKNQISERGNKTFMYYLRYANDKDYSGNHTEINRCISLILERLSLDYLEQFNTPERIILYRNLNRGQALQDVNNPKVFEIELKNGFIEKQPTIYAKNLSTEREKRGWADVCKYFEDFSRTQKALTKQ